MTNGEMFNSLTRVSLFLLSLYFGLISSVFAIDFSQAFSQATEKVSPIAALFDSKNKVSNIYKKALKLAKDNEIVSSDNALQQLVTYYDDCAFIRKKDIIRVLLHSNSDFGSTFSDILPTFTDLTPSKKALVESYGRFFTCKTITDPQQDHYDLVANEINELFYSVYFNSYTQATLHHANFGSDMFWNGSLDDSDFDILHDIHTLGKIFFDGFIETEQILFYRMPQISQVTLPGGSSFDDLFNQSVDQLGPGGPGNFPGASLSGGGISLLVSGGNGLPTLPILAPTIQENTTEIDPEITHFIESTNTESSFATAEGLSLGNQCVIGSPPSPIEDDSVFQDPLEYISDIYEFIENLSNNIETPSIFNNFLPSNTGSTTTPPLTSGTGTGSALANTYAEQMFGDAQPGTCEYQCRNMSIQAQAACELSCAATCIASCTTTYEQGMQGCTYAYEQYTQACQNLNGTKKALCLTEATKKKATCIQSRVTEQALCVSDCTCFMVSGPNGPGWEKIEDMYRIKFCKVPVQNVKTVKKLTHVGSIQAIFQVMYDVLIGLRDSGQTIKKFVTKEYLDSSIQLKFADNLAFKAQLGFKPVFTKETSATKVKERKQKAAQLIRMFEGTHVENPEADNWNKYIVISDYAVTDALKEASSSYEQLNQKIDDIKKANEIAHAYKLSPSASSDLTKSVVAYTNVFFVKNMIQFLGDNQLFWHNMSSTLLDINKMTFELKEKIKTAK